MAGKIDRELFITNLKKKHGDKVDLIGEYCGKERKVTIIYHCEKHGDTITTLNAKNIFGRNFNPCKECFKESHSGSRHSVKDKQHYYQKLTECCKSHCGYVIETEWTKAKDTYHFKCDNPDHPIFENTADGIMNKHQWCPYCSGRKGDFEQKIVEIVRRKNGELLSQYVNSKTHVIVRCIKHNYQWKISPINLIKGRWCPVCNMSINEKVPYDWFNNNNIHIIPQYKFDDLIGKDGNPYRFDFAILDEKCQVSSIVEIDDETHRGTSEKYADGRKRDIIKNDYCRKHNIPLYRIPIDRCKISQQGYDWYYTYIDNNLKFLKGE